MLSLLSFLLPLLTLSTSTRAASIVIDHGAQPNGFFAYEESDAVPPSCNYSGNIHLGHPMSVGLTDKYYVLGSQMLKAAHLSLNAINLWPRCGVHLDDGNYSVSLTTYGDNSDKNTTRVIGNTILDDNRTDFLLAGYSSSLTGFLAPVAQEHRTVLVTAGSSRNSVFEDRDHVFGILAPSKTYLENAFLGLKQYEAKTVAYVTEEGVNSCLGVPGEAQKHGMDFLNGTVLEEEAPLESYLEVAKQFHQLNPDVVVTCIRTTYALWNQALRQVDWSPKAQVYTLVFGTPEFEQALGADLPYSMGVSSWDRNLPDLPDAATGWTPYEFDRLFEQATFRRPAYQHVAQSAALSILVQALERVGNTQDMPRIRHAVATGSFATVYGNVSFDANGQNSHNSILLQYDSGSNLHVLEPKPANATHQMVYPLPSFGFRDCEGLSPCAQTNGTCNAWGGCDCQLYQAVSEGRGPTARCVVLPEPARSYLGLAVGLPIIIIGIFAVGFYYYHKHYANQHDDSLWKISPGDLHYEDPPQIIGRGSFGLVLLAEYRGTPVAVKKRAKQLGGATGNKSGSFNARSSLLAPLSTHTIPLEEDTSASGFEDEENPRISHRISAHLRGLKGAALRASIVGGPKASITKADKDAFAAEMRCLNALRHPTIVTFMGAVMEPTQEPAIVMEYMQHGSLYDMLHNETMLLDDEILLPIVRDITSGCRYLHSADPQILHGDLKSANILVDGKFRAKVSDFGLASLRSTTSAATGTPLFMAPELLNGSSTNTAASDMYSFGMILYEVFSRKDPYEEEEDLMEVLKQIVDPKIHKRPPAPKDCPAQIASLMQDCLVAAQEERPSFVEVDTRLKRIEPRKQDQTVSLLDIFPKHIAEQLQAGKKVEPEHKESVTIFFSDIVNYTSISSELDPRKVASMLDRLYQKFDALSDKHEVFKVETIGDAYMAVTNLVKDQSNDHAVRIASFAAEAIQAANETLIDEEDASKGYLNIRCGFHSGPVVADVVGTRNPRYCLFGDSVNTASRMESNSDKNRILCSEAAAHLLRVQQCKMEIKQRGRIKVKGKGVMTVFWVGGDTAAGARNLPKPECAPTAPHSLIEAPSMTIKDVFGLESTMALEPVESLSALKPVVETGETRKSYREYLVGSD